MKGYQYWFVAITIILLVGEPLLETLPGDQDQDIKIMAVTRLLNPQGTRSLDWAEWERTPIVVNGNASDWIGNYTAHPIGRTGLDVDLYIANDENYLYICVDAKSDRTDEKSVNDFIRLWIDGDNDNSVVSPIGSTTNESTQDNWISICGNSSARSNTNGIFNDAGWLNTGGGTYGDPGVYVSQWFDAYQPYLQNRFVDYLWSVGFNGTPKNMVYEIGIPLARWNWTPGDEIGACLLVFKHGDGNAIGIWPANHVPSTVSSWKDFFLATPNDKPVYSDPLATPGIILNDNENTTLLTVEAQDPDGNISEFVIDLSAIGGSSKTTMVDNGTKGDAQANDDVYSYEVSIPTIIPNGTYYLPFTITDDHTPNIGRIKGVIGLTVLQHNRQPEISANPTDRITLIEDQNVVYINLTPIFRDPDESDSLVYSIMNGSNWESHYRTPIADYRVHLNHSLSVKPLPDKFGSESISVSVKDAAGLSPDFPHSITVTILPRNDPPRLTAVNDSNISAGSVSLTVYEDHWSTFFFSAEDIDEDPLSYSTNLTDVIPELRKNEDYIFSKGNGTIELKPRNSHVGKYRFLISIDDGNGGMDSVRVNLTIVNKNDPPYMDKIATKYVEQDEWLEILPMANDDDEMHGDVLTFSTNFSKYLPATLLKSNFHFNSTTGEFRFKPDKETVATYDTYIEVVDLSRVKFRRNFKIKVNNINDPPEAPEFDYIIEEGNLTVTFTALPAHDPDRDNLTYTWDFGDGSQNKFGPALLTVVHTYRKAGNYTVILWVSDGYPDGINRTIINITVTALGGGTGPGNGMDGELFEFSCTVSDHNDTGLDRALIRIENMDSPSKYFENFTNSLGKNRFFLPAGNYTITVTLQGFTTWSDELRVNTKDIQKDIVLKKYEPDFSNTGENEMGEKVADWVWLLLGLLVLLVVFGIIMLLLIKKKSRKEKGEEMQIGMSTPQEPSAPMGEEKIEPPSNMMIQPLAPLEMSQYSQEGLDAQFMTDGYSYAQEDWAAPSEGKIPEELTEPKTDQQLIEGKMPDEGVDVEISQLAVEGNIPKKLSGSETLQLLIEGKMSEEPKESEAVQVPEEDKKPDILEDLLDEEPHDESDVSTAAPPLQIGEQQSIQDILKKIILRDNLKQQYGITPKPPKTGEDEAAIEKDVAESDVSGVFDDLVDDKPVQKENILGTIQVERVAISKIDGAEMKICNLCKQPFNPSEAECPSCSNRNGITLRCPICASEVIKEMVFCKKCGTNLRNLKAFKMD